MNKLPVNQKNRLVRLLEFLYYYTLVFERVKPQFFCFMRLLVVLLTFLFLNQFGYGQSKTFTFKGQVHSYGDNLKDATIEVYNVGDLIIETSSKGSGKFEFELEAEQEYMVEISKEGLRTKTIWINTKRTSELKSKIPTFAFDVYLKKDKVTRYDELSEMPVTLIKYQPEKKEFYMDKTYEDALENKKRRIEESGLQRR